MAVLSIRKYPDPCLREKAVEVVRFDEKLRKTLQDMTETMYASNGIGLAAPQVGLGLRVAVIDIPGDEKRNPTGLIYLVNPRIVVGSGNISYVEGCLSFPGLEIEIQRYKRVVVEYQDERGVRRSVEATDLFAVCLQHEIDHLDGILFIDRADPQAREKAMKEWNNAKNQEDKK